MKFLKSYILLSILLASNTGLVFSHKKIDLPIHTIESGQELAKVLHNSAPTMIMLHMKNCPHCDSIKGKGDNTSHSYLQDIANHHPKLKVYLANGPLLQANVVIKQEANISIPGYPTFIFVKNGQTVDHLIGGNKNQIKVKVNKLA